MRRAVVLCALFACSKTNDATSAPPPDASIPDAAAPIDAGQPPTCVDHLVAPTIVDPVKSNELVVMNDPEAKLGIFDPNLVSTVALSYSAVKAKDDIETRIAVSSDEGMTWTYATTASPAVPAPNDSGNLIHETSSLVVDPDEPDASRRWKLFTHRYLAKGGDLHYDVGNIALQTAPAPGGPWSTPTANIGWRGASPFSSDGAVLLAEDAPGASDCVFFTEPSALTLPNGVLALTLGCVTSLPSIRVVLFFSRDHAASWTSVGTLVPAKDGACLGRSPGLVRVNAASLFSENGKLYVWLTPESATGYHGCASVEVTDLDTLTLARNPDGSPTVTRLLTTPPDQFSGACTSAEGKTLMSIAFLADARPFRIFAP